MSLGFWDFCTVFWVSGLSFVLILAVLFKRFLWAVLSHESGKAETERRRIESILRTHDPDKEV